MRRTLFFLLALATPMPAIAAVPDVAVKGAVAKPLSLTWSGLHNFPVVSVNVTQKSGRGPVTLDCSGAALSAVLDSAQPKYGEARNAKLAHALIAKGGDGYTVLLAMAEIDALPNRPAPILATVCNGRDLPGPRLIVPGDAEAGRSVNGVVSLEVVKW